MKRIHALRLFAVCALAALAALGVAFAADTAGPSTKHKPEKAQMHTPHAGVQPKPAIAQKPFEMVEKSGKKVTAETMIEIPGGKKVKAAEYYAKLNDFEAKFNKLGYSLKGNKG